MATTCIPHRWTHDVFVSFRGEDIRKGFMDHLFKDFKQKGINAFKDDDQTSRGEEIPSLLYKAIEESRFLMVIFSKNYASSSWCLRELVKILECNQMGKHKHDIRIFFYDIEPSVVRHQTGSYAEAFAEHETKGRTEVAQWKEALSMAAGISGYDLQNMENGYEAKNIDNISKEILEKLGRGPLPVGDKLVGVDARVKNMNLSRYVESREVNMIGICGISGIGKTTLAKVIYNQMRVYFEECSFLENVQGATDKYGLIHVLMQVISDIMKTKAITISNIDHGIMVMRRMVASKKILLVLDNVGHSAQFKALVGSRSRFSSGSLILFTSEDKQLLRSHEVKDFHDMEFLDDDEALELFSLYAFGKKHPTKEFKELALQVVKFVKGYPLALEVLGRSLYDKTVPVWRSNLDMLQTCPHVEIQHVLRLGYEGLNSIQKKVFLDIAFYRFSYEGKDIAVSVFDSCNLFGDASIEVLVDRSLVTIKPKHDTLDMHDLIRRMAKQIVREESNCPGKRSRLCIPSEIYDVLNKNKVTEAIEVLILWLSGFEKQEVEIDFKGFSRMTNLRILELCHVKPKSFCRSLEFLSNELRLLTWREYPFEFLPSNFYPENIVLIDMSHSNIKNLWTTSKGFKRLKTMNLRCCRNLTNTPDFTEITNLERLDLEDCVNLVEAHPSIGMLKRLVYLNMRNCRRLRSFPCKVEMDSLKELILSGCLKVDKLPEGLGTSKTLVKLCVDQTAIEEFPSFVLSLTNLQVLSIGGSERIPCRFWTLILRTLCLSRESEDHPSMVLPSLARLCFLRHLNVSHCNISEVSLDNILGLSCLEHLNLSWNDFTSLPASFSRLSQLRELILVGCKKLEVFPSLAGLRFLQLLNVSHCNISEVSPDNIGGLSCLQLLNLSGNNFASLPATLSQLSQLTQLILVGCKKLEVLPKFPPRICDFDAIDCTSLRELQKQSVMHSVHWLNWRFINCPKLVENYTIESLVLMLLYQGWSGLPCTVNIKFQGSRIPGWFTTQSTDNHVKIELPPGWCYNKFTAFETCLILKPKKPCSRKGYDHLLAQCKMRSSDGDELFGMNEYLGGYHSKNETIGVIGSDVIWLSHHKYEFSENTKNFVTFSFSVGSPYKDYFEIKKCAARLVGNEDDVQEERGFKHDQHLLPPTQDVALFHVNHLRISKVIED